MQDLHLLRSAFPLPVRPDHRRSQWANRSDRDDAEDELEIRQLSGLRKSHHGRLGAAASIRATAPFRFASQAPSAPS